jgi:hypothetical protein
VLADVIDHADQEEERPAVEQENMDATPAGG